jgi:hypothetical protein
MISFRMWRNWQQNTASHLFYGMICLIAPLKMSHFFRNRPARPNPSRIKSSSLRSLWFNPLESKMEYRKEHKDRKDLNSAFDLGNAVVSSKPDSLKW